jgi:hypothetical protein
VEQILVPGDEGNAQLLARLGGSGGADKGNAAKPKRVRYQASALSGSVSPRSAILWPKKYPTTCEQGFEPPGLLKAKSEWYTWVQPTRNSLERKLQHLETKIDGAIGTIILDHPERRNALSRLMKSSRR